MIWSRNFPVFVNLPKTRGRWISQKQIPSFTYSFSSISHPCVRTQACPNRKQVLARDARREVGEVLGAVVDAVLVPEAEAHACVCLVRGGGGGGGVGIGWGDEVLDGGAHVVC